MGVALTEGLDGRIKTVELLIFNEAEENGEETGWIMGPRGVREPEAMFTSNPCFASTFNLKPGSEKR